MMGGREREKERIMEAEKSETKTNCFDPSLVLQKGTPRRQQLLSPLLLLSKVRQFSVSSPCSAEYTDQGS